MAGPDDRTRRIPPSSPREADIVAEDPAVSRGALLDELRSLKRLVAGLGILAVAALGVALWALLAEDDGDGRRGASVSRVNTLEERVDQLESDVQDAATDGSVSELRQQVESLQQELDQVAEQAQGSDEAQQAQQQAEELAQQVEDLQQQIDELSQQGGGTTTP